jgi:amino acid transporter
VAVLYIVVGQVFVSAAPYDLEVYEAMQIPLRETAELFLPGWLIPFLTIGAFTAALTSLNAGAIAIPREIFAQARDNIAPQILGKIHEKTRAPQHAVALFFALVVLILFFGMDVDYYGLLAAIGILIMSSMMCIACLFLPKKYPDRYRSAYIVFPVWLLWFCTIITILVSLVMFAALFIEKPSIIIVYFLWILYISLYYKWRTFGYTKEDWQRLKEIPGNDELNQQ